MMKRSNVTRSGGGKAATQIKRQFPAVQMAVAPLGQGDPERQWRWFRMLKRLGCYQQATYLADHNAFINRPFGDRAIGQIEKEQLRCASFYPSSAGSQSPGSRRWILDSAWSSLPR